MFVSLPFLSVAFSLFALLLFLFSAFLLYSVLRSASSLSSFLLLCPALFLSFTLLCLFSFSSSDFCLCLVSCPPLFLFCCVPFLVLSPQLCLLVVFVQDRGTALSRDLDFIGSLLCSPLLLCCVLVLCSACSELSPCSFSLLLFVLLFCSDAFCKGLCSAPCFALLFFRFGLAPLARLPLLALLPLGCGVGGVLAFLVLCFVCCCRLFGVYRFHLFRRPLVLWPFWIFGLPSVRCRLRRLLVSSVGLFACRLWVVLRCSGVLVFLVLCLLCFKKPKWKPKKPKNEGPRGHNLKGRQKGQNEGLKGKHEMKGMKAQQAKIKGNEGSKGT